MRDENITGEAIVIAPERPPLTDPVKAQAEIDRLNAVIAASQAEIEALTGAVAGEPPESYEPKAQYRAEFARPVTMGSFRYTPRQGTLLLKGSALNRIVAEHGPDAVRAASKA